MQEWITNTMNSLGYLGIGLLMFLENLFPPIPSELIMPLAGYTATFPNTQIQVIPAIAAGVIGTILGAIPWYYAGLLLGQKRLQLLASRYGKWIGISGDDIEKSTNWFQKHGSKAVLFGRLVPGIRTLISIPAGISKMPVVPFFIYSTIGTIAWVTLLTYAGYFLGKNYKLVEDYIDVITKVVVFGVLLAIASFIGYRLWKRSRK
ncbi:MAG: DedA family protein [Pseudanabaena sp.]|jgi:membrane protein DedA with SNARE-associated domain|uniref:DedA family protein n=1 Tax=Microcystis sp. M074S1 TaxID=2771126 RepID=UPI0033905EC0|nr:DedA family protein [Microcystis sp. M074S1]MCA6501703.1 DedA family protein [Pseudanabaena sp. M090S1SP2A07QC]MCA6527180.1 DedA family protein [Pseudanabaena sp. M179S2SP2A07QC]MCA6528846.1 DedA family protein [Pseudanabaena sp. M125S2SP2A07QC]MCA6533405.1 DedA family protein [Pseudanabaena sp. M176S2SP2A07QC]MCA6539255.1 DedA family protein [Pseudanabaena sp. M037S2SP2A07QC]MCA6548154.1 DedA family protein [Pseudanabaena sp. M152S2SP2A07QC]MCA6551243.1 DedA family protein [Pseudanabaena